MRQARLAGLLALAACTRLAEERARFDLDIGVASAGGADLVVAGGMAHVRAMAAGSIQLWAQAPVLELTLDAPRAGEWEIAVDNCMPDAELTGAAAVALPGPRPTARRWRVTVAAGPNRIAIATPDADRIAPWRFAAMADFQEALPDAGDVFAVVNAQPGLRFAISMGDLVDLGTPDEYDLLEEKLALLAIPFYATIGNHELFGEPEAWRDRFGRFNLHFTFKGVTFSIVDSGHATVDPLVYEWLDGWMAEARALHVFATHYPPHDPVGMREGAFESRREADKLLGRLAAGGVDLTLYGHVHTYEPFENAGIPAFISGGGGAWPVRFDGIGRHFLVIDADPSGDALVTSVVRVD